MKYYGLPKYPKTTTDVVEYAKAWRKIGDKVAKRLNCRLIGMDPGFLLSPKEGGPPISISVEMANRINRL